MIVLQAASLEKRGIHYRTAKHIQVRGRTFQKAESFSKRVHAVAVAQCEQYQVEGTLCLLVESANVLTIWREVKMMPKNRSIPSSANAFYAQKPSGPRFLDRFLNASLSAVRGTV